MKHKPQPSQSYTGEVRFRQGFGGVLILQVQILTNGHSHQLGAARVTEWVDARVEDITRQKMPGAKP